MRKSKIPFGSLLHPYVHRLQTCKPYVRTSMVSSDKQTDTYSCHLNPHSIISRCFSYETHIQEILAPHQPHVAALRGAMACENFVLAKNW